MEKLGKSNVAPVARWDEKEFLETLNKQGAEDWEVCLCNYLAVVLQKGQASQKWEYKVVRVSNSHLTSNPMKDDEAAAFTLILEGLEAQGWKPCAVGAGGQDILVKRSKGAEGPPAKKEKKD